MNINHLNQITPELVKELEELDILTFAGTCCNNRHLIIVALEAALRLKHELSSTKGDEG